MSAVDDIGLFRNPLPVCPHCGTLERDYWELQLVTDGDSVTNTCGHCGLEYRVTIHVDSPTYSTAPP